ncbi:unnamed protein product [Arabis nemorensis]|uniref:Uncharacterized protein n=1 Tax=Arabis nemorensis TaxID=586526 RepID=A0A565BFG7_9BRAS|nr:unnamed protein product [Arabis nemorensis]
MKMATPEEAEGCNIGDYVLPVAPLPPLDSMAYFDAIQNEPIEIDHEAIASVFWVLLNRVCVKSIVSETGSNSIPGLIFMMISDPDSGLSDYRPLGYNLLLKAFLIPADSVALEEDKCSAVKRVNLPTGSAWYAPPGQGFENFTSRAHQRKMLDWVPQNVRLSRQGNAPNAGL